MAQPRPFVNIFGRAGGRKIGHLANVNILHMADALETGV